MTSTDPPLAGARPTRQRLAVAEVLTTFEDFRSAQEIHGLLTKRGENVGLATVYRTLQKLSEAGDVDMLRTEDGEAIYRRFLGPHGPLSAAELRYLTEVDHHDHEAILAIDPESGRSVGVECLARRCWS